MQREVEVGVVYPDRVVKAERDRDRFPANGWNPISSPR